MEEKIDLEQNKVCFNLKIIEKAILNSVIICIIILFSNLLFFDIFRSR